MGEKAYGLCNGAILVLLALVTLYPFLYVVFASVSDPVKLLGNTNMLLWPAGFTLNAYKKVFSNAAIYTGYMNTIFYVVAGTSINIVATCMAAYVLSRKQLKLRRFFTLLFIFTMYFNGGLIPNYLLIKDLGMINSRLALIIPGAVSTFNLMIMITGFEGIPQALEESARIDGANDWVILFKIIMPLAKPTIMVIMLYYAVGHWNSWFNAMVLLKDRDLYPLQLLLKEILVMNDSTMSSVGSAGGVSINSVQGATAYRELVKYCVTVIVTAPILCIYPFLQKYFVKGVFVGSIKG